MILCTDSYDANDLGSRVALDSHTCSNPTFKPTAPFVSAAASPRVGIRSPVDLYYRFYRRRSRRLRRCIMSVGAIYALAALQSISYSTSKQQRTKVAAVVRRAGRMYVVRAGKRR